MSDLNLIKPNYVQNIINKFCVSIGMIPTSYKNALTYEQQILAIGNYLEKVVYPAINTNSEALAELQNLFIELKDYVNNYFDNLDVQEEINNKLDEMAEGGELADIIAQYLELQAVLGFNNISDMRQAEYIANASLLRTYGQDTLNDGKGAFYYVRNVQTTDTIDNINIVALHDTSLVAVKCSDLTIQQIQENISNIQNQISFMNSKKVILIGDSYAQGGTPEGQVTAWQDLFISKTGLTNTIKKAHGGVGFINTVNGKNFKTLMEEVEPDSTVTDIIVLGGYNDMLATYNQVYNAINSFKSEANSRFPNAEIHIGMVGWSKDSTKLYDLNNILCHYRQASSSNNCHYLNGIEYTMHRYFDYFSSDGFHPNQTGQYAISDNLVQAWKNGTAYISYPYTNITLNFDSNIQVGVTGWDAVGCTMTNNIVEVTKQGNSTMRFVNPVTKTDRDNVIEIGTIRGGYIVGSHYGMDFIPVKCFIKAGNNYYNTFALLQFVDGKVQLRFGQIADNHTSYVNYTNISEIQIAPFHGVFNSEFC